MVSIVIEHSSIYWDDTQCNLLIFENIDNKKELIKLKEETQYKDTVLSNVSHEFRTPLNCIIFMLESIKDQIYEIRDDIIEDYIEPALGSARMLLFQVNDLLDHAQIINGKLRVLLVENNLVELGKEIVKLFEFLVKTKNLNIFFEYDIDLPQFIETDAMRFKQIINNLLGNSIKFTKTGSLTLKFQKENNEKIKISVIDTGIGISQENQQKLFNTFSKVSNEQSSQMNPHGIGLVKALNQNENEKIYVQSKENEGSTFYFFHQIPKSKIIETCEIEANEFINNTKRYGDDFLQFPNIKLIYNNHFLKYDGNATPSFPNLIKFQKENEDIYNNKKNFTIEMNKVKSQDQIKFLDLSSDNENTNFLIFNPNNFADKDKSMFLNNNEDKMILSRSSIIETVKNNSNIQILAVDDSGMNLLVLKQMCKKLKINIKTSTDGKDCIQKLEELSNDFNLICIDCEMPIMDGFEATKIIVEKMKNNEIKTMPIIGCTGHSSEKEIQKCISLGMKEVLIKPFDIQQFKKIIDKYC